LGACASKPERIVTLIVKDTGEFTRTVDGTSAEGIVPQGGGGKVKLLMRNHANGDLRAVTLYCDGTDWMVTSHEARTAGTAVPVVESLAFKAGTVAKTDVYNDTTDVELSRFSATASTDLTVKSLSLRVTVASPGSLSDINALTLVDADTGVQLTTPINVTGDVNASADVHAIGTWKLLAGKQRNIRVIADIPGTMATSASIRVSLGNVPAGRLIDPGQIVTANGADFPASEITPSGAIIGQVITVSQRPVSLIITRAPDDSESAAGIVVAGAKDVILAKYKFSSSFESLKIVTLSMYVDGASSDSGASFKLYDGSTLVAGPSSMGSPGWFLFDGMNVVIPSGGLKTLTVKADLPRLDQAEGSSGMDLTVFLNTTFDDGHGQNSEHISIVGATTSYDRYGTGDIAGNTKILRKTKPTVTTVALPTTTLASGSNVASRFAISADAAAGVAMQDIVLNVSTSGGVTAACGSTGSGLRRIGDGSDLPGTCSGSGPGTVTIHLNSVESISAGTSRTYESRLSASGVHSGSSLGTSLTVGGFRWFDGAAIGAIDGTFVRNLPTSAQTLSL
jgi:hypothetical protein